MKLLGRYPKRVANQYNELLMTDGIEVKQEGTAINNPFGNLDSTWDSLFVQEGSYEKAIEMIKSFEANNEIQVKEDSKKANQVIRHVLLVIILIAVVLALILKNR